MLFAGRSFLFLIVLDGSSTIRFSPSKTLTKRTHTGEKVYKKYFKNILLCVCHCRHTSAREPHYCTVQSPMLCTGGTLVQATWDMVTTTSVKTPVFCGIPCFARTITYLDYFTAWQADSWASVDIGVISEDWGRSNVCKGDPSREQTGKYVRTINKEIITPLTTSPALYSIY